MRIASIGSLHPGDICFLLPPVLRMPPIADRTGYLSILDQTVMCEVCAVGPTEVQACHIGRDAANGNTLRGPAICFSPDTQVVV